ncbi:mucin-like glycoprotein [Trypanosoma rangeli]|uniref:Mucin-like glycoprotein n=1 Tax=Trypanosoma rangeli TaxID=5698 RepID=A0A422NAP3_TRYRA|nr:mucin-like glycoprotein [Trypanosoma rangeli]RNF02540.1 mucin-like glycoprotein [Trypanosoma rangeli]|eukprot:RNF02540.1 mucin-like glycoprotein [Trypanosoma rangeli]
MAIASVQRRAVCAVAILALLCGCCFSAWAKVAATPVTGGRSTTLPSDGNTVMVPVDVFCPDNADRLSFRFHGGTRWIDCVQPIKRAAPPGGPTAAFKGYTIDGPNVYSPDNYNSQASVCSAAELMYTSHSCNAKCPGKATVSIVAFTMSLAVSEESGLYGEWKKTTSSGAAASASAAAPSRSAEQTGVCLIPPPGDEANGRDGGETTARPEGTAGEGDGQPTDTRERRPTTEGPDSSFSDARDGGQSTTPNAQTGAPNTTSEGTNDAAAAGGAKDGASATGTDTTAPATSPTVNAKAAASLNETLTNADSSDTVNLFVPTPLLLLLLVAALVCTAG